MLELFFDFVLVFTITRLTEFLVHDLPPVGFGQLLLFSGVSFWMYGGHVWLTYSLPPTGLRSASFLHKKAWGPFLFRPLASGPVAALGVGALLIW
jgi:hypothetical protein